MDDQASYEAWLGRRVIKARSRGRSPKPFQSGLHVNTVKGILTHPQTGRPAFTFVEDGSYVECRVCEVVEEVSPKT
jgi:hypothetical protein